MTDGTDESRFDDDFGTRYVTASHRISVTLSVPLLIGLLIFLQVRGLIQDFPVWMLGAVVLWIVYASVQSVQYYRQGYSNYTPPDEEK